MPRIGRMQAVALHSAGESGRRAKERQSRSTATQGRGAFGSGTPRIIRGRVVAPEETAGRESSPATGCPPRARPLRPSASASRRGRRTGRASRRGNRSAKVRRGQTGSATREAPKLQRQASGLVAVRPHGRPAPIPALDRPADRPTRRTAGAVVLRFGDEGERGAVGGAWHGREAQPITRPTPSSAQAPPQQGEDSEAEDVVGQRPGQDDRQGAVRP